MSHPGKVWDGLKLQGSASVDRMKLLDSIKNEKLHMILQRCNEF